MNQIISRIQLYMFKNHLRNRATRQALVLSGGVA